VAKTKPLIEIVNKLQLKYCIYSVLLQIPAK
jgi:hypothetical protein